MAKGTGAHLSNHPPCETSDSNIGAKSRPSGSVIVRGHTERQSACIAPTPFPGVYLYLTLRPNDFTPIISDILWRMSQRRGIRRHRCATYYETLRGARYAGTDRNHPEACHALSSS
jgi:hypothetical protein